MPYLKILIAIPAIALLHGCASVNKNEPLGVTTQAATCSAQWIWAYCSQGEQDCQASSGCRNAVVDTWLKRRRDCESDPVKAAAAIDRSCKSCNRQYCKTKIDGAEAQASGTLTGNEWRVVYSGSTERCYTITFVRQVGESQLRIQIESNGVYRALLYGPNESADICGNNITIRTYLYSNSIAYWDARLFQK